ncbi:YejG family protein [Citrobacter sp. JGM124]|uniref:YejG family protein n=1 Tax=Citrobacter sp. JGM124 TaxID=2799789 RepID=UPI001BA9D844|nr:YejG family protein [Citrobacter sp. JGM124]MBS0846870.1 hypothetical protein [Citrobacter sp. JGM124]
MSLNILQLSIVHRLPQSYRWCTGFTGSRVEPVTQNDSSHETRLIGLKLLGHNGETVLPIMDKLSQALSDIDVASTVVECEGELCLFVSQYDEPAATCRLKNCGVAIAESVGRPPLF